MKIIISPAKSLDYESKPFTSKYTHPQFLDTSKELVSILKKMTAKQLSSLMGISETLGKLNYERYQKWKTPFTPKNAKQAIFAFNGAVYKGFDFSSYTKKQFELVQERVRILSGLYGLLRPLDLIQPYRLEMGASLPNKKGKDLYSFWKHSITSSLKTDLLVNLASKEYFEVVNLSQFKVVTPIFKDYKGGSFKVIGLYAKKARGLFANWLIKKNITNSSDMKKFSESGYVFHSSTNKELIFHRKK